jgi:hypothetical protein
MDCCPWCGGDATGNALIGPALQRVSELLALSRIGHWGYRVLLRPGVSGVDPAYPKIVEIEKGYAVGKPAERIDWPMLVGLIVHELGHSFLYHHLVWGRTERFRRAFGDVDALYDVPDDVRVEFHHRGASRVPVDHVTPYAGLHPQEDFAETFRLYVTRGASLNDLFSELRAKRKAEVVKERFQLLHEYVQTLADRVGS